MKLLPIRCGYAWTIAVAIVVVAVLGFWAMKHGFDASFNLATVDDVRSFARRLAPWAALGALGLMVLHSFVPLPGEVIAVANGLMFGPVWGTAITWTGAMIGAVLSFGLSRVLGRPLLRRLVAERYWRAAEAWRGRPSLLLVVRLLPMVSFNVVNYVAGLSGVTWWTFVWTTGMGILPVTVLSVLFGHQLDRSPWFVWGGAAIGLVMLVLVGRYYRAWLFPPAPAERSNPFDHLISSRSPRARQQDGSDH